jgi:hypothetical protein
MVLRGVLIIFVASGCATAVITARPEPVPAPVSVSVVDAGVAVDAGVPVVVPAPVYVSMELQPCGAELRLSSLVEVLRSRPTGEIAGPRCDAEAADSGVHRRVAAVLRAVFRARSYAHDRRERGVARAPGCRW